MTVKEFVRKILVSTCVVCTLISVFFYLVAAIVNGEDDTLLDPAINLRQFLLILLFSLLVALANRLLTVRGLHIVLRILIHYATLLATFFIVFIAAGKLKISGPASVFLSVMIFTVLYAVCFTAGYFLLRLFGAIQKPEKNGGSTPYDSRFR